MTRIDGRSFILDAPTHVPALWGDGPEVLWASGEGLVICGPQGTGKTTLAQRLALARVGVGEPRLLGYPVQRSSRKVLYIAADRPRQIARSARRMVTEADGETLARGLIVWRGPLPFNLQREPERLHPWVQEQGDVGDVIIDSLKDLIPALASEEGGGAFNRAVGGLVAEGLEVVTLHHQRKGRGENPQPNKLSDVYGSTWITSGQGSVVCLWGDAGDTIVELTHLKQPAETVGPLGLRHDHAHGRVSVEERLDVSTVLLDSPDGVTAAACARRVYGSDCDRNGTERARRKLDRLVNEGRARKIERPTGHSRPQSVYVPQIVPDFIPEELLRENGSGGCKRVRGHMRPDRPTRRYTTTDDYLARGLHAAAHSPVARTPYRGGCVTKGACDDSV
jgi:replicative DNA helicase